MAFSIAKVANWLHQVDKARAVVGWWPAQFATDDERLAYKVQDAFLKKQVVKQGPLVGYKIALTSPQILAQTGLKGPAYGPIRKKRVFEHKATVRADRWTRLGVELEIILIVNADVPKPKAKPYDKDSIAQYVGEARAGFELIEDRGADYSRLAVNPLIMDAGWNGGSLLAKPNKDWAQARPRQPRTARSPSTARSCARAIPATCWATATIRWPGSPTSWATTARRLKKGMIVSTRQHGRLPVRAARQHRHRQDRGPGRSDAEVRAAEVGARRTSRRAGAAATTGGAPRRGPTTQRVVVVGEELRDRRIERIEAAGIGAEGRQDETPARRSGSSAAASRGPAP